MPQPPACCCGPGAGDWRTWLLGVYCLLKATNAPLHMLQAFFLELPPPPAYAAFIQQLPAANRLFAALYVPAFLFAPAFLWAFARECPRVHRRTWLDDLARRMIPASVLIGAGLWVACAVTLELAQGAMRGRRSPGFSMARLPRWTCWRWRQSPSSRCARARHRPTR